MNECVSSEGLWSPYCLINVKNCNCFILFFYFLENKFNVVKSKLNLCAILNTFLFSEKKILSIAIFSRKCGKSFALTWLLSYLIMCEMIMCHISEWFHLRILTWTDCWKVQIFLMGYSGTNLFVSTMPLWPS